MNKSFWSYFFKLLSSFYITGLVFTLFPFHSEIISGNDKLLVIYFIQVIILFLYLLFMPVLVVISIVQWRLQQNILVSLIIGFLLFVIYGSFFLPQSLDEHSKPLSPLTSFADSVIYMLFWALVLFSINTVLIFLCPRLKIRRNEV